MRVKTILINDAKNLSRPIFIGVDGMAMLLLMAHTYSLEKKYFLNRVLTTWSVKNMNSTG